MRIFGLISVLAAASAAQAQTSPLLLTCGGGGAATKFRGSSVYASGSDGSSVWAQGTRQTDVGFEDQVDVRLFDGDDRVRMPHTMLPPVHGGDDGWFKLKNVVATDKSITASVAVNALNNPKIHIDRMTATISINGKAGTYTGRCQKLDANIKPQF